MLGYLRGLIIPLAIAGIGAFTIQATVAKPYQIPTPSMVPTIQPNDRVIANRLIYHLRDISRGDIVVFEPPPSARRACQGSQDPDIPFVKRVIGLGGDTIEVTGDGRTLVNDRAFDVPAAARPNYVLARRTVPEGDLFVLGDNRPESCDSHEWGAVPEESVIGQAEVTYWPLSRVGFLD